MNERPSNGDKRDEDAKAKLAGMSMLSGSGSEVEHSANDLELRLTSLLLGEASDFERSQLEALMNERPDLRVEYERLQRLHASLSAMDLSDGDEWEHAAQAEWKLSNSRRASLLAVLDGKQSNPVQRTTAYSEATVDPSPWSRRRWIWVCAGLATAASLLPLLLLPQMSSTREVASRFRTVDSMSGNIQYYATPSAAENGWTEFGKKGLEIADHGVPVSPLSVGRYDESTPAEEFSGGSRDPFDMPEVGKKMEVAERSLEEVRQRSAGETSSGLRDSPDRAVELKKELAENQLGQIDSQSRFMYDSSFGRDEYAAVGQNGNFGDQAGAKAGEPLGGSYGGGAIADSKWFGLNADDAPAAPLPVGASPSPVATPPSAAPAEKNLQQQLGESQLGITTAPAVPKPSMDKAPLSGGYGLPKDTVPVPAKPQSSVAEDRFGRPASEPATSSGPVPADPKAMDSLWMIQEQLPSSERMSGVAPQGPGAPVANPRVMLDNEEQAHWDFDASSRLDASATNAPQATLSFSDSDSDSKFDQNALRSNRTRIEVRLGVDDEKPQGLAEGIKAYRETIRGGRAISKSEADVAAEDFIEKGKSSALSDERVNGRRKQNNVVDAAKKDSVGDRQEKLAELDAVKALPALVEPEVKRKQLQSLDEQNAAGEPFSTFSLHVSDVSFKLAASALAAGQWPDASKVRIEEFVNAFDYLDPLPTSEERVTCQIEQAIHPFMVQRNVLRISLRTAATGRPQNIPLRLTLLLDNSGSMERADRRQSIRRAFEALASQVKANDQVTLISFANRPRLLAERFSGSQVAELVQLVESLPSEGGTNLEAALKLAFEKAAEGITPENAAGLQNRIVLMTDGAVNLGDADPASLSQLVMQMRDAGIAFDAAGISAQELNDEVLESLTRQGDGRYYLLDSAEEASSGFAEQIAGALRPAAKNVKVQVEFNPERVGRYKLLGFEKHLLKQEDFRNDKVDAAEMAAAEAGVAIYQFQPKPDGQGDIGSVSVRFQDLATGTMIERRWPIPYDPSAAQIDQASPRVRLAATAAMFACKLRGDAVGDAVELKSLADTLSTLPTNFASAPRVQQLQTMINAARQVGEP